MKGLSVLAFGLAIAAIGGCSDSSGTSGVAPVASIGNPTAAMSTSDFQKKVNQIQPGTPKTEVIKAIGKPDQKIKGVAGEPRPGPQPPATINVGSRYEHWIYVRGGTEYHLFLGSGTIDPGHWVVLSSSANPVGAVAH